MSLSTDPVLSQRNNWKPEATKKAADEVIDRVTDCCNQGAKKVAHGLVDCCSDSLESLQDASK